MAVLFFKMLEGFHICHPHGIDHIFVTKFLCL